MISIVEDWSWVWNELVLRWPLHIGCLPTGCGLKFYPLTMQQEQHAIYAIDCLDQDYLFTYEFCGLDGASTSSRGHHCFQWLSLSGHRKPCGRHNKYVDTFCPTLCALPIFFFKLNYTNSASLLEMIWSTLFPGFISSSAKKPTVWSRLGKAIKGKSGWWRDDFGYDERKARPPHYCGGNERNGITLRLHLSEFTH